MFLPGDIFIFDRGFRDVLKKLENNGFVTKLRFVIEIMNGILKSSFRIFDHVWLNNSIPHLMLNFKIACAIFNAYFNRIESEKNDRDFIAASLIRDISKPNLLLNLINDTNLLEKKSIFDPERRHVNGISHFK